MMIMEGMTCSAETSSIGMNFSTDECALAVIEQGSPFFERDPNDGECRVVFTESAECPEGFVDSPYYDFYGPMHG
jgi:hypothetical protein